MVEGKTELLVLFYITRVKANYNVAYNIDDKNDHLRLDDRYFANLDNSIVEIDKKVNAHSIASEEKVMF